jgi:hypothetical protein
MLDASSVWEIDWVAPIGNVAGQPTDLSPPLLCKVGPTLAALGDPSAIVMPPAFPPSGLMICSLAAIAAAFLAAAVAHILKQGRLMRGRQGRFEPDSIDDYFPYSSRQGD